MSIIYNGQKLEQRKCPPIGKAVNWAYLYVKHYTAKGKNKLLYRTTQMSET